MTPEMRRRASEMYDRYLKSRKSYAELVYLETIIWCTKAKGSKIFTVKLNARNTGFSYLGFWSTSSRKRVDRMKLIRSAIKLADSHMAYVTRQALGDMEASL